MATLFYHLAQLRGKTEDQSKNPTDSDLGLAKSLAYKNYLIAEAQRAGLPHAMRSQLSTMLATNAYTATSHDSYNQCDLRCISPDEESVEHKTDTTAGNIDEVKAFMAKYPSYLQSALWQMFSIFTHSKNMPFLLDALDASQASFDDKKPQCSFQQVFLKEPQIDQNNVYNYSQQITRTKVQLNPSASRNQVTQEDSDYPSVPMSSPESYPSNRAGEIPFMEVLKGNITTFFNPTDPKTYQQRKAYFEALMTKLQGLLKSPQAFQEALQPLFNQIATEVYGLPRIPQFKVGHGEDLNLQLFCPALYRPDKHEVDVNIDSFKLWLENVKLEYLESHHLKQSEFPGLSDRHLQAEALAILIDSMSHELMHAYTSLLINDELSVPNLAINAQRISDYQVNNLHYNSSDVSIAVHGDANWYYNQPFEKDAYDIGGLAGSSFKAFMQFPQSALG